MRAGGLGGCPRWQGSPDGTVTCNHNNSLSCKADVCCLETSYIAEAFKKLILGNQLLDVICPLCAALYTRFATWGRFDPPKGGAGFLKMWAHLSVRYLLSSWCYPDGVSLLAGPTSQ